MIRWMQELRKHAADCEGLLDDIRLQYCCMYGMDICDEGMYGEEHYCTVSKFMRSQAEHLANEGVGRNRSRLYGLVSLDKHCWADIRLYGS